MYKEYFLIEQLCLTKCDFCTNFIGSHKCRNECPYFIAEFKISENHYLINCKKYNKFREEKLKRILDI
jgi:hypothetical protein